MKATQSAKLLKFFLEEKKKLRPGYSLRALSRDLGYSQSYMSEIFSGKKLPSPTKLVRITQALGMDAVAKKDYEEIFLKDIFPDHHARKNTKTRSWNPASLSESQILRKWYYVVLIDLVCCDNFKNDVSWMAGRLGISSANVHEALQWLQAHKYIVEKDGGLLRTNKKMRFHPTKSLPEIRAYHRQMIDLAARELVSKTDAESYRRRLITGITFSCNPKKIELVKKRLMKAIYSAADDFMDGNCTEVYQINLQIFPHTTPSEE